MKEKDNDSYKLVINGVEHEISDEVSFCFKLIQTELLETKSELITYQILNKFLFIIVLLLISFIVFIIKFYA